MPVSPLAPLPLPPDAARHYNRQHPPLIAKTIVCRIALTMTLFFQAAVPVGAAAQPLDQGPRIAALGGIGIALSDERSGTLNPAAFGTVKGMAAAMSVSRSFGLSELDHYRLQTSGHFRKSRLGVGATSFGFKDYRLQGLHVTAVAAAPGVDVALGVTVSAYRLAITGEAPALGYASAAGATVPVSRAVTLGAAVHNLIQIGKAGDRAGRVLFVGFAADASETATILFQVDKETDFPATIRAGIEARPLAAITLRGGVSTAPASYAAGLGVHVGTVAVNVAAEHHSVLGWSRSIGTVLGR